MPQKPSCEQIIAERAKALEHVRWTYIFNAENGLAPERILGMSDAIAEDTLLLLEIRESMTAEQWAQFLKSEGGK